MRLVHVLPFKLFLGGGERFIDNWMRNSEYDSILYAQGGSDNLYKTKNTTLYTDYQHLAELLSHHHSDTIVYHCVPEGPPKLLQGFKNIIWYAHGAYAFNQDISQWTKPHLVLSNYKPATTHHSWDSTFIAGINLGVDLQKFQPDYQSRKYGKIRVGFVGRISEEKIPPYFFDFLKLYEGVLKNRFTFYYYGKGLEETEIYQQFISKSAPLRWFNYMGAIAPEKMPTVYHQFDILLVPSLTESGSYSIVEAQACGLKVYALNRDGIPHHALEQSVLSGNYDEMLIALSKEKTLSHLHLMKKEIREESEKRFCVKHQVAKLDFMVSLLQPNGMTKTEETFSRIFAATHWKSGESVSGSGSERSQTATLVKKLKEFFDAEHIKSLLDIPCGDMHWITDLLPGIDYCGGDIVEKLVAANRKKYPDLKFKKIDLVSDDLSDADFLLVRDCLVHLPYELIKQALKNIARSNIKFVGITTFTARKENADIEMGQWRPINLQLPPFNLPEPIHLINEECKEAFPEFTDKSLAIWRVEQL